MDKRQSMPYLPFLCPYFVLIIYYPYTPLSEKRETSKSGSKTIKVGLCNFIMLLIYLMPISSVIESTSIMELMMSLRLIYYWASLMLSKTANMAKHYCS